ncbi:MAG TPA: LuxR C-terminal-related transcriptional regulator [Gemmatimonadaceae bacterium]|nr:LuxR C-terminal-related transcriptional regulator [Gemmatimonadaceae bacterium]
MTRIAIVAPSEALRSALAAALRGHPEFEVVSAAATRDELRRSAEVVLVAEEARSMSDDEAAETASIGVDARRAVLLTAREREVLQLLADGLGNKQIAARLGISTSTVKTHLEELFDRLDVASRAEAVAAGVRRGLLML